jgi:hypothetical protein
VVFLNCEIGKSQELVSDKFVYHSAVEYCRGTVPRPMALGVDQRVLCFDGWIYKEMDVSLAKDLKEYGFFVVRSLGGDVLSAIALSDLLRQKHATVVVYDYCFAACAGFFLIASIQTYVVEGSLVARHSSALADCGDAPGSDELGPRNLRPLPCPDMPEQELALYRETRIAELRFYGQRLVDRWAEPTPDSLQMRRLVRSMYDETGVYPNVAWTLHPRDLRKFNTRIDYEAYPESQEQVDAMAARLHLKKVIYVP